MYSFYYDHLKVEYADRCTLLFTDMDSMCCEIQTDDLYADMMDSLDLYDTSNFDRELSQYNDNNRRELGKFKSETGSVPPREFVGLRAKMYSLQAPTKNFKRPKASKSITFESTSGIKISSKTCAKRAETLLQSFVRSGRRTTR